MRLDIPVFEDDEPNQSLATVPLATSVTTSSVAGSTTEIIPSPSSGLPHTPGPSGIGPEETLDFAEAVHDGPSWWGLWFLAQGAQLTLSLSL